VLCGEPATKVSWLVRSAWPLSVGVQIVICALSVASRFIY
jgi:hypothetical protein